MKPQRALSHQMVSKALALGIYRQYLSSLLCAVLLLFAATVKAQLLPITVKVEDTPALMRGLDHFEHYCGGCHTMTHLSKTSIDGIKPSEGVGWGKSNAVPSEMTPSLVTKGGLPSEDANQWFGRLPPDLSLIARARGASWLYTYLSSFYADPNRPFGCNNLLLPNVAMPNVLFPLQGWQVLSKEQHQSAAQPGKLVLKGGGALSPKEFDAFVHDLVAFLVYAGEPHQLERRKMGLWVLAYMLCLTGVLMMYREFYIKRHPE